MKRTQRLLITFFVSTALVALVGCKKKSKDDDDDEDSSTGSVSGIGGRAPGQTSVSNVSLALDAKGVDSADAAGLRLLAGTAYPGFGVNAGESVVDGMKIWLTDVTIENQEDMDPANPNNKTTKIFDWASDPKELQIAKGFAGTFKESVKAYLKPGEYNRLHVSMLDKLSIKAYAFLDTDNDGTIDTTIYTTAAAVTKAESVLDPDAMPADYDYYTYGYIGALSANSLTNSTAAAGTLTVFDKAVVIPATEVDAKAAAGEPATATETPPVNLSVSLVVDTTYLLKVWDGRFGTGGSYARGNGSIPAPEFPFPETAGKLSRETTTAFTQHDFYPEGSPAFGLGNYIPMFAFANIGKPSFQVYAFSLDTDYETFWAPNSGGAYKKTLILTVALDSDGKPLLARTTSLAESLQLFIGALGRVFEEDADGTYTFYTNYGVKDANGKDDGGMFYHSDKTMAGHSFSGFDVSAAVGAEFDVKQTDGPRCSAEYNYCVGAAGKTLHVKRLK